MLEVATDVADHGLRTPADPSRVGEGWFDRLIELPSRLPGPAVMWFVLLFAAIVVFGHLAVWLTGDRPVGQVEVAAVGGAFALVYALTFLYVNKHVSRSAFRDFAPALEVGDHAQLASKLTNIPDRYAVTAAGVMLALAVVASLTDPVRTSTPIAAPVVAWALWQAAAGAVGISVLVTLRQLRWVSRLHAMAIRVDIFDPRAINSLSRLTATSAIGILVISGLIAPAVTENPDATWLALAPVVTLILIATASFVLPLRGMHERLNAEKGRLLGDCNELLKLVVARIHRTVDTDDLERADQLQKTLASLLAERDVLARLPTWPWSPGTFRGFATAALLPIALWLMIRVLERVV